MSGAPLARAAARFGEAILAREVLVHVAETLATLRIDVMPLKGVVLHALVYPDAMTRPVSDVDVAVRSADFDHALAALLAAGYTVVREEPGRYEVALVGPRAPIAVDLHRRFAASRRYRLDPDAMFARGRPDATLLGCRVVLPDDLDLYAHLLAHATLDHVAVGRWPNPGDLDLLVRARSLDAAACAARLEEHGLGRVARVGLAPDSPLRAGDFAAEVLLALRPDPAGDVLATAITALRGDGRRAILRRTLAVLLNPTLVEAARAVVERLLRRP